MTKYILLALVGLLSINNAFSSDKNASNTIFDAVTKEPLVGVNITIAGTNRGTVTDLRGAFSLPNLEGSETLLITYVGYKPIKVLANKLDKEIFLEPSSEMLNQIIVSASRERQERKDAPVALSIISPKNLEETNATSLEQVLNQTSGVLMISSSASSNEQHSMSIRTPLSYRSLFLYLEDGLPIRPTGVFNHNALLEINQGSMERIEIIKGPASSIYGSEAIGGAINFITKRPTLKPSSNLSIQADNLGYKRTDFGASTTLKKFGVYVGGYYAQRRNGLIEHSDYDKLAITLRGDLMISDKTKWSNTVDFIDYRTDMTGSLDSAKFYGGNYESNQTFTDREVDALRYKSTLDQYWNINNKTTVNLFVRNNSIRQTPSYRIKDDYKPHTGQGDKNLAHGETNDNSFISLGSLIQHQHKFNFLGASIIGGALIDYSPNTYWAKYIRVHKTNDNIYDSYQLTDSLLADYKTNLLNTGIYSQFEFEPITKLKAVLGLRMDHFVYDYDNHLDSTAFSGVLDSKNIFSNLSPKVGLTYSFNTNSGVYANFSLGFVPPQISELYRGTKVPRIKPSQYQNMEIGGWLSLINNKVYLDYSLYQIDGLNTIVTVRNDDGSFDKENAGKVRSQGIEYGVNIEPNEQLTIRFSGTNADHRFLEYIESGKDYSNSKMDAAPGFIANASITYRPAFAKGFMILGEWQHVGEYLMAPKAKTDAKDPKVYESYDVFNARLAYEFKGFKIWTTLLNLEDRLYSVRASASRWGESYSLGSPRTISIGIGYNFKAK